MIDKSELVRLILSVGEKLAEEDFSSALSILWPLVELRVPGALQIMGTMYQCGIGVDVSGTKAEELLKLAADVGDALSAHHLGTLYATGAPDLAPNLELSKLYHDKARALDSSLGM